MCYMEMALIYLQQWQNSTTGLAEPPPPLEPAESNEVMMMMMQEFIIDMSLLLVIKFQTHVRNAL